MPSDAFVPHTSFPGEGEMARRCRAHDWGRTPLGPVSDWPASLRAPVRTVLTASRPMLLCWGPELVQIYNDAFRPVVEAQRRHPDALGTPARDSWPELWDLIRPKVDQVLATGVGVRHELARVPMPRDGGVEATFWHYFIDPVHGDDGAVQGVLLSGADVMELLVAARSAREDADRLTAVFESITDVFFALDVHWNFRLMNAAAERFLQRGRSDLLGRNVWAEYPESVGSVFEREYRRAVRDDVAVQFEADDASRRATYSVHAFPSREGLAVFMRDVTRQRTMEARLRERDRMLSIAGRMARIGAWDVDLDSQRARWSDEVCDIHEVPHGTSPSVADAIEFYAPEWRPVITEHFGLCAAEGRPFDLTLQLRTATGRLLWVRAIGEAVRDADGVIRRVQGAFQDVQQLKDAQEALQRSERWFRELAESMPLIVWSATSDGRVDFQTRNMQEYSGMDADALAGTGWLRAVHPDDAERVRDAWDRAIRDGTPYEVEYRIRRADGDWRTHLVRARPVHDQTGSIVKWFGTATDIHDQLEMTHQSAALARRLGSTLESITDAFMLLTPEWRFAFVNSRAERILASPRESLIGHDIWTSFPGLVGTRFEDECRQALRTGESATLRMFYGPLDRWYDFRIYPSAEGLAIYFRDVTSGRVAEMKLREQAQLLDRTQDAITAQSLDHRVEFWNAGAERLYGWSREEALGHSIVELLYDDPEAFETATAHVLNDGEWTGELEQRRKDGTFVTVEGRWTLVNGEDGAPSRILSVNTDVSERKRLLQQFLRAQRLESIGTLAGGIAHDLNNVLAPILLSIEFLRTAVSNPELVETLEMIEASAQRGADMVRQVLGFARGFEGMAVTVHPARVVEELLRVVSDTFPKNIRVRSRLPGDLPGLVGDPTQLHQVLMNLLVNARDALPAGGEITVEVERIELDAQYASMNADIRPGRYLRFGVTDTGTGMPPEVVAKIFDPFFTTKEVGKGTGLGLSTVAAIARSHGGFVTVYSERGRGSTFHVYLPADARRIDDASWEARSELYRGSGETVLVVDDEHAIRDVTRQTLEAFGYAVVIAIDGADAIATYAQRGSQIDVVLTDMVMPNMDGPTMIRALLRIDPAVRIIAASGLGAEGSRARALELGAKRFLPKPYTAESLLLAIHGVLHPS